ncbi:hypothetical protein PFISCL1PPCAC_24784, partial [Pristionchus fissidentatus]
VFTLSLADLLDSLNTQGTEGIPTPSTTPTMNFQLALLLLVSLAHAQTESPQFLMMKAMMATTPS